MLIMFSLGLSLSLSDFTRLMRRPIAALAGIGGQILLLPCLATSIAIVFQLSAPMAVGLLILAACPGGVTSNAVVFAARGDVALSVTLTAISSLITIISAPLIIGAALLYFYPEGQAPSLNSVKTIIRLLQMTVIPVALGMIINHLFNNISQALIRYLRPTALLILVLVIAISIISSFDLLVDNIMQAGPAIYTLNISAMVLGLGIASLLQLGSTERLTLSIEIGVQNATMATFLSLAVLNDWALAIVPTLYGCIMLFNAGIFIKLIKRQRQ